MKFEKKKNTQYIREIVALITVIIFLLMMYASFVSLAYQANSAHFVSVMNQNYKQQLKSFADSKLEQLKLNGRYIGTAIEESQMLLNGHINLILSAKTSFDEKYSDLIELSKHYQNATIVIVDKKNNGSSYFLNNGEVVIEALNSTVEQVVQSFDFYESYEVEQGSRVIISGYTKELLYQAIKSGLLNKFASESLTGVHYAITEINNLEGGDSYGEVIFSSSPMEDDIEEIPLICIMEDKDESQSFRDILDEVRESGSGFTIINWGGEKNQFLIYSVYSPEYQWIISVGTEFTLETVSSLLEYEEFRETTKFQLNLAIMVAFISFLMAVIGGWLVFKFKKSKEIEYERERNRIIESHNRALMSKNQQISQIVHDIKNHLICIKGLIRMERFQQTETYIDSVFQDIHQISDLAITGNRFMDIILNEKIHQMEVSNIIFNHEIEKVNFDFMDTKDITIIFTNLFDNAIESCEKSEEKVIHFNLFTFNDGFFVIKIRNSCDIKPISIKEKLYTTKSDRHQHGYGVSNIIRAVKKYRGETLWEYHDQEQEFSFVITIPIPKN